MDELRIQIVNYKTKEYLLPCLKGLFKDLADSKIKYTVAILDNASGDDLSDVPEKFPGKPIEIYQNKTNVGFGAGHNVLAKQGSAKYLLILNPDIEIIESHTLERLVRQAEDAGVEVAGPRLVTVARRTQRWDHGELRGFKAWLAQNAGHAYWRERSEPVPAAWVSGAAFLVEKVWFDRLGGFDENFFLYTEELEFCFRLRAAGGKIIYDPTITMLHHGSVVAKKSEYQRTSNEYFLRKHFRWRIDYPLLWLINWITH